jgi:hypothetical protein
MLPSEAIRETARYVKRWQTPSLEIRTDSARVVVAVLDPGLA